MERWAEMEHVGWGRYPRVEALTARPDRQSEVKTAVLERDGQPVITYGNGRSYGDAALIRDGRILLTRRLDKLIDFDPTSGWLTCEAGVTLETLNQIFVPRGFFPPVVPGTQFVTVGGALANDIHGKNHHVDGTFADHVRRVSILTASGEIVSCDAETEPDLFWATVGGLGLTGVILSLQLKMHPVSSPFIEVESIRFENLDEFFRINGESSDYTHTVSWIDSVTTGDQMGRGIFIRGRHAPHGAQSRPGILAGLISRLSPLMTVPINGPNWLMNQLTMKMFNTAYYRKHPAGKQTGISHYTPFFFPLDAVRNWNRIYGKRGMLQYQLVVPHDPDNTAIREVLKTVTDNGMASFLSVIKEFGETVHPGLSFPQPGITLALDFPNHGPALLAMLDRLDEIVVAAGGRVYLGKDARLSRDTFRKMYPKWEAWKSIRDTWDPNHVFQSELGRRLGLVGDRS